VIPGGGIPVAGVAGKWRAGTVGNGQGYVPGLADEQVADVGGGVPAVSVAGVAPAVD